MRRILGSDKADFDVEEIRAYSEETWGTVRAEKYVRQIFTLLDDLGSGLRSGEPVRYSNKDNLRAVFESHILYFSLDANTLFVERILHVRRNQAKHLRS